MFPPRGRAVTARNVIRTFVPAWFILIMGTSVVSILFFAFPYGKKTRTLRAFSAIFFFFNFCLFVLFNAITIARHIMFPKVWSVMTRNSASLFLGAYPMGLTTLIDVGVGLLYDDYGWGGKGFLYTLWGFWWVVVIQSAASLWVLFHFMQTRQKHSLDQLNCSWTFPTLPLIVGSSTGGLLSLPLAEFNLNHAMITIIFSYLMMMIGVGAALMLNVLYILRLIVHGPPPGSAVMTSFLPLGPSGQGGFGILLIGQTFRTLLPLNYGHSEFLRLSSTGETINAICIVISMTLWAMGFMWLCLALLGVQDVYRHSRIPFEVTFWGLIFPNGVYALCSIELGQVLDSKFFRIFGAIYAIVTLILWIGLMGKTIAAVWTGQVFEAQCLEDAVGVEKRTADSEAGPSGSGSESRDTSITRQ
jgi:tellurite resistance protein TehA-like permease